MKELRGNENQIKVAENRLTKMNETISKITEKAVKEDNKRVIRAINYFQQELQELETATSIINLASMIDISAYATDFRYRKDFGNYFLENCKK